MGNGINNWNPGEVIKNWRMCCINFDRIMPFMGQTLWQVGPLPWMMGNNSNWFANSAWGQVGDFTQFSGAAPAQSADPTKSPEQTHEEKREAHVRKVALEKKYDKLLKVLKDYVETLDESDKKERLKFSIDTWDNAKTQENYANLLTLYNDNKDNIKQALIDNAKLTAREKADLEYDINDLNTSINDDNDKIYASVLKSDFSGLKDDVDVLDLISTYNTKKDDESPDFISAIVNKRKNTTSNDKKASFITLADKIENALEAKYDAIKDNSYLTDETKKNLKKAFKNFDKLNKQLDDENYVKVFNEFYTQLRLAEAEKADAEIAEKLGFLSDTENEFKSGKLKNEVIEDLKQEGFENPTAPPTHVPATANSQVGTQQAGMQQPAASQTATQQGGSQQVNAAAYVAQSNTSAEGSEVVAQALPATPEETVTELKTLLSEEELSEGNYEKLVQDVLQNQEIINKDTIVEILDKYPDLITTLDSKGVQKNTINRVVKAVMRKAIDLNLQETEEYKALEKFFGAKGTPNYEANSSKVSSKDTFEFTENTGKDLYYELIAKNIQNMVNALVNKIKKSTTT